MSIPGNQTTLISTLSMPEMTDLVRRVWTFQRQLISPKAKQLFITEAVGRGQGSSKIYNEIDVETFASNKPEGTNNKKSRTGVGYNVTMTARTFSKEIDITFEMRNDNRYQEVGTYITNLATFCTQRQELDLTHRLTFCDATSYTDMNGDVIDLTVGDGFQLAYNAHTLAFSPITYSNRLTGDPQFSEGAFEAAKRLTVSNIYSNFGEKRVMNFNTIICGDDPTTNRLIDQLLKSTADVNAVQAGVVNVYQGAMRKVALEYLATTALGARDTTKEKWWFIAATGDRLNGWQAYVGEWETPQLLTPSHGNNGEDIHNLNWTYVSYCRYGIAVVSPKGLIASLPRT